MSTGTPDTKRNWRDAMRELDTAREYFSRVHGKRTLTTDPPSGFEFGGVVYTGDEIDTLPLTGQLGEEETSR